MTKKTDGELCREILAGDGAVEEFDAFIDAVEGDEGAHARALLLAKQDLVERLEPIAQRRERGRVLLADLEHKGLKRLGAALAGVGDEFGAEVLERRRLLRRRRLEHLCR